MRFSIRATLVAAVTAALLSPMLVSAASPKPTAAKEKAAAKKPEVTLKVGDAAPKLDVGKWIQGGPVKGFDKGKVYVVEFWATWCGPCRATIPHLNELSQKHKDVTFIGVDVFERQEDKVAPFVKEMGEKMTYPVVLDNKSQQQAGAMAITWMRAAGQNGIPCAFIVGKDGNIAWIGHPAAIEQPLAKAIGGKGEAE